MTRSQPVSTKPEPGRAQKNAVLHDRQHQSILASFTDDRTHSTFRFKYCKY